MICKKCKENKSSNKFYLDKTTCYSCRRIASIKNKQGIYSKSENRITLESFVKKMDRPMTSGEIRKATLMGVTIYSMLANMIKHGHIKRINTKPFKYERIEGCDYLFNVRNQPNKSNGGRRKNELHIDDSNFNQDLEIERRIERWLSEGLSEEEIIKKLKY